jgi:amino acid transporter
MPTEVSPLKRSMKMPGTLFITLSAITPTSAVFIIAPGVIQQAGTGAFLSFLAAAFVGIFMAFVYAELSSAYPLTGGEYAIVGRVLGPLYGFIVLGLNFISFPLIFATLALGIASYVKPLFPDISPITAGLATVIITTLFGILNIRLNAFITGIFLGIELIVLVILSYLGLAHPSHSISEFVFNPVYLDSAGTLAPASFGLIGLATAVAIFAYNGYGQAVYFGEETHDAPKNIVYVIFLALAIAVIAEAVPVTAFLLGSSDLASLFKSQNMLSDFIELRGGVQLSTIVSLGVALAILNALIAIVLMCSRQFYSSGRDRVWPHVVNHALTRIHGRFHSPWVATLIFGVLGAAACFIDQNLLFVIIGTSLVIIYAALCCAVIASRRKGLKKPEQYKMPFYPLPPIAGLLALAYVIYANYQDPAVGRPSLWATSGMILVSAAYYFIFLRRRGKWELQEPAASTGDTKTSV